MDEETQRAIQDAVKENMEASRRTLLGEIGTLFDKISQENNSSQLSKLSHLIATEQPTFKRKSNEEQFKSNNKLLMKMNEANSNLEQEKLPEAKSNVTEAIDMLTHRQKLIQLADRSELGWRVVQEYESNPLAEDSDDEKRMYKAEARATKKLKAERAKKSKTNRNWPYKRGHGQGQSSSSQQTVPTQTGPTQKPGLCFHCGKPGHWRQDCPGNVSNNKISTYIVNTNSTSLNLNGTGKEGKSSNVEIGPESTILIDSSSSSNEMDGKIASISGQAQDVVSPVGRLKRHIDKWRSINGSPYILDVIENGYKIPFKEIPPTAFLKNNRSARDSPSFVTTEIGNLLEKGVISVAQDMPKVVNPLTVAYNKKGKPRMVLDCRHINEYVHLFKMKFEDAKVAMSLFGKGIYVFTYDLKSAYHHIDISDSHKCYLGFCWIYLGKQTYFVYNSLPFGLSSAGHIFSKTVRVIVSYLRGLGHNIVMFLDDGIGGDADYGKAAMSSKFVREVFCQFGFLIAEEKCFWTPCKVATWLGYVFNYELNKLFVSEERIELVEKSIDSILYQIDQSKLGILNVRVLASLIGRIISLQLVFGSIVRLRTREMYNCIITRASWNAPVLVSKEAMSEIMYWKENTRYLNSVGKALDQVKTCDVQIFCDASAKGYGGYADIKVKDTLFVNSSTELWDLSLSPEEDNGLMEEHWLCRPPEVGYIPAEEGRSSAIRRAVGCLPAEEGIDRSGPGAGQGTPLSTYGCNASVVTHGMRVNSRVGLGGNVVVGSWIDEEQSKSSSWREAEAVNRVLKSQVSALKGKLVTVFTDNKNVTSILSNGSTKYDLQKVALEINDFCTKNDISLSTEWIPRDQNQLSDYLSRCQDSDDWSISKSWFNYLNCIWGRFDVHRFSSHYNNQCERFNSRWWVPGTEGIDAFTLSWKNDNNWLVPPPRLILECINKIEKERPKCTLIIPKWKSAAFWSRLVDKNQKFMYYVKEVKVLPLSGSISVGKGNNGVFSKCPLPFQMHALKIDFKALKPKT